ncbi:MAG TPA: GIY-YIG nuclease family protein [Bacteroidia bacterium]|nr:GIY-YIG nuclease family protein [Bacteroidia bacterium]
MPLPYCVYILFSQKDELLYTGYTSDIEKRLLYHNEGRTKSTASRRPLILIFCEFYLDESDARKREKYFKTSPGKKAVKLMLGNALNRLGYKSLIKMEIISD